MTKVSVIVPIYNVEEYLEECLDSLVHQTIDGLEIILVDDGSTDNSGKIAQQYADSHENVSCHHIENGGLGHARNYGVQFAHGTYVCFADSDDVVPDYAYQEMYELGEKHGCDMVIGDVKRFNSKREYSSGLHRRAFRNAKEVMHITSNTDLLYDTTSWNKLFRYDFYQREKLKWAEGILYEDIPVSIPAHYMANKVAYLKKIVYKWRARDGASASITQRRGEIDNFIDRLSVLKMVDTFFDEHVTDQRLQRDKEVKWLGLDLKMYIDALPDRDEEYQRQLINLIADYLPRINEDAFQKIHAIDRIKYYFIGKRDLEGLLSALRFEKRGMKTLRVRFDKKTKRYYGNFPFNVKDHQLFDMTDELRSDSLMHRTRTVGLDEDNGLTISGNMSIRLLDVKHKGQANLQTFLVDSSGREVMSVDADLFKYGNVHTYNVSRDYMRVVRRTNVCKGFKIVVDAEALAALPEGTYGVAVAYQTGGLSCDRLRLGRPVAGGHPRPYAVLLGDKAISIDYDVNYYLCINVEYCRTSVERAAVVGGTALEVNNVDGTQITRDIDLESGHWQAFPDRYFVRTPLYQHYGQSLVQIVGNRRGELCVQPMNLGFLAVACSITESTATVDIEPPAGIELSGIRAVRLVGDAFGVSVSVPYKFVNTDDGQQRVRVCVELQAADQVSDLRADKYGCFISCADDMGNVSEYVVYNTFERQHSYPNAKVGSYRYTMITGSTQFRLEVSQIPEKIDASKRYHRLAVKYLYPLMRLLPLKKDWIVFEAYWGSKTDCNPGAFYEYIAKNHPEYTCIWSLKDKRIKVPGKPKRVVRDSLEFYYVMARAKYLINNVNFVDGYEKRHDQIEIQTMHGTPLKTLGLDVPGDFPTQSIVNAFLRRCNRWDYLVVQSTKVEEITRSCYAYKKQYLETGYPRNDILFNCNDEQNIAKLKQKYGINPNKKFILYAPTWRRSGKFELHLDLASMANRLGSDYQIGLRVHHLALSGLDKDSLDGRIINVSYVKSMEELFLISDIVITDYSSLMFDYAILGRPLLFYVYDLEEYRDHLRGFNIDLESEAPGPLLFNTEEVIQSIQNIDEVRNRYQDAYRAFRNRYCTFESGHASEQIFNRVFNNYTN